MSELFKIQQSLKVPKGQQNTFGKYKYRSCEDILEALKVPLGENSCYVVLSDSIEMIGDRFYIKATASLKKDGTVIEVATAYARESLTKKGMDDSQVTGTASSYARKYALNGLFAIDDTKDADTNEHTQQVSKPEPVISKPVPVISSHQYNQLVPLCMTDSEINLTGQAMLSYYKIQAITKLPASLFSEAMDKAARHSMGINGATDNAK